jgi:hypothetical protein
MNKDTPAVTRDIAGIVSGYIDMASFPIGSDTKFYVRYRSSKPTNYGVLESTMFKVTVEQVYPDSGWKADPELKTEWRVGEDFLHEGNL